MRLLIFKFLREPKTFHSSLSSLLNSTLLAFLGVLICTAISYAAQVTLEWDANSEPNISGYNVYYGKSTRDYDVTLDVGNWTSVTIADLEESEAYYFAVTAYDLEDNESGYSKEACINCASQGATNSSGGGGGGGCFIDTLAFQKCPLYLWLNQ
jgi:hypothetical protein